MLYRFTNLFVLLIFFVLFGCVSINPALQMSSKKCADASKQMTVDRFGGLTEEDYQDKVVAEHWKKKSWGSLPVDMRKNLMSTTEDVAEKHYNSAYDFILINCMSKEGFFLFSDGSYYPVWRSKTESVPDYMTKIEAKETSECLVDSECGNGFFCNSDRYVCVSENIPTSTDEEDGGCKKDVDCKGERICEKGVCTNPDSKVELVPVVDPTNELPVINPKPDVSHSILP